MQTIAVIGANGKVGTELCLVLKCMGVRPVAICRSSLSAASLVRYGIECRIGSFESLDAARALLHDCDVVCDMTLPTGPASEVRRIAQQIIGNAIRGSRPDAKFVYASTYAAFGMSKLGQRIRWYRIAGTVYGANKRAAEKFVSNTGRVAKKEVFILRLGQCVFGELQPVSEMVNRGVNGRVIQVPAGPSNTIFVFSIAEAIRNIGKGKEAPGVYTGCSNPQWSWREVHEYYAARDGITLTIVERPSEPSMWRRLKSRIVAWPAKLGLKYRNVLISYLLPLWPSLEAKARGKYLTNWAGSDIAALKRDQVFEPDAHVWVGDAPGRRLISISDSRTTMEETARQVRALIRESSVFAARHSMANHK